MLETINVIETIAPCLNKIFIEIHQYAFMVNKLCMPHGQVKNEYVRKKLNVTPFIGREIVRESFVLASICEINNGYAC